MKIGFIFFFSALFFASSASAKLIEPKELLSKILDANQKVSQFYLTTEVTVYDPEASAPFGEELEGKVIPHQLPTASFTQDVLWIRDEFLGIETRTVSKNKKRKGKVLHVYIEAGGVEFSQNLSEKRLFYEEDVLFHYSTFFTKHLSKIIKGLNSLGVGHSKISFTQENERLLYQLGEKNSNVLVELNNYRIPTIEREIHLRGRYYPYRIQFGRWLKKSRRQRVPGLIQYFIDGRLIKTVTVKSIALRGLSYRRKQIIKKYKKSYASIWPFSLETSYGN